MRSALLTVAPFAERCLHDPTSLNMNEKCLVMAGFERPEENPRRAGTESYRPRLPGSTPGGNRWYAKQVFLGLWRSGSAPALHAGGQGFESP